MVHEAYPTAFAARQRHLRNRGQYLPRRSQRPTFRIQRVAVHPLPQLPGGLEVQPGEGVQRSRGSRGGNRENVGERDKEGDPV